MKRSEAVLEFQSVINDFLIKNDLPIKNSHYLALAIMDKTDDIGMSPPSRRDFSKFRDNDGYSNSWEDENT